MTDPIFMFVSGCLLGVIVGAGVVGVLSLASVLTESQDDQQEDVSDKYHELLYAVAKKHPGESRHETALRYIQQAENGPCQTEGQQEDS